MTFFFNPGPKRHGSRTTVLSKGIVKLIETRLTDSQDDGFESCREHGMLGVGQPDSA